MTVIGVLSDTHLDEGAHVYRLEELARRHFRDADMIVHAGDVVDFDLLLAVFPDKPVFAVRGNMDRVDAEFAPPTRTLSVEDVRIGVAHGHGCSRPLPGSLLSVFPDAHAIVYGHTHVARCERIGGVLAFNPGSPWRPRDGSGGTVGRLVVDGGGVTGEIIPIARERRA